MLRCAVTAVRAIRPVTITNAARVICNEFKNYSTLNKISCISSQNAIITHSLIQNKQILDVCNKIPVTSVRTVTKFSLNKGKRKTVKAVIKRFFRLHWGAWIRPKVGRKKRLWKRTPANKRRLRQHVFCNATQTTLLDKMVTKYWKRPKHYVDDPYAPFHTREEFRITRKKPIVRD